MNHEAMCGLVADLFAQLRRLTDENAQLRQALQQALQQASQPPPVHPPAPMAGDDLDELYAR